MLSTESFEDAFPVWTEAATACKDGTRGDIVVDGAGRTSVAAAGGEIGRVDDDDDDKRSAMRFL